MGWKGTLRSINAAAKRADRHAKRRQRELLKNQIAYEKMQELEKAAYEVDVFENYIDVIQSIHKDCGDSVDWLKISTSQEPAKPLIISDNERQAIARLNSFAPSFIDKLFGKVTSKRQKLEKEVSIAKVKDTQINSINLSQWNIDVEEWKERVSLARRLLNGDISAKIDIIKELNPFSEIDHLGSGVKFTIQENGLLIVTINVHGANIIPKEQKTLLKSGRLSIKSMPVSRFNEIYQDYVCSVVLRVANEIFSILPDDKLIINAEDHLLNKSTGHLEPQSLLSVYITRDGVSRLNMEYIDPSDAMNNFIHNANFKKTKGFEPVKEVKVPEMSV
ncbi:hypothetical protein SJY04_15760 [Aeromonas dhakensis]|uniref:hypothetical protein n=1 Tax=Aeromonas dhakensis TaxID=196024 RepID=UPI0009B7E080|nr:hypothetical protein [Aeromonas dhakensis]MBL0674048.1 hypothetical protein [Aeromonas dhakensis]MDX7742584.1 hypothetical protein [Aeromonas dhakensis]WAG00366.1 hypothetical protein NRZ31_06245 [Aeromonas dhakensis]WDF96302.1 hypothetical protein PUB92_08160 [Aeromonas dhakensis]